MKLNNKGFAVSTLLYGVLTMIVLILLLLLNIQRSNYNKENRTTDEIKGDMNKCISKQIVLEKCYEKANVNCTEEKNAYLACLGLELEDNPNIVEKTVDLKNTLIAKKDSIGLFDDTIAGRYVFKGANPNNYIKIGSREARIISIEPNGTFKIIFSGENEQIPFDNTRVGSTFNDQNHFIDSILYNKLKSNFNVLDYNSQYVEGKFYTGAVSDDKSIKDQVGRMESVFTKSKFGIISFSDYIKGSSNSECDPNSTVYTISQAKTSCTMKNWLNPSKKSWTTTTVPSFESESESVSKYSYYMTYSIGGADKSLVTEKQFYSLVVFLPDNTKVAESGDGSQLNPYVVNFS